MAILEKVKSVPNICEIEVAFNGELVPSSIPDWQQFFNSTMLNLDFTKTYIGLASVDFSEESVTTSAGTHWKQNIKFRFPATDKNRAERLQLFTTVKYLKIKFNNGLDLVLGRNDFYQNTSPKHQIKSTAKLAEVEFETLSIVPSGFVPNPSAYALPTLIPISLE
jgi:hypothetical protein